MAAEAVRAADRRPKVGPLRQASHAIGSGAFAVVAAVLRALPVSGIATLAGLLGGLGYRLDGRHRRIALDNLERALPELGPSERRRAARGAFRNLAATVLDAVGSAGLDAEAFGERLTVEGWERLEEAEEAGRGVLLMTAHLGNWEAAGQLLPLRGRPMGTLARPMRNPRLDARVRAIRERFGNETVPKRAGARRIFKTLRAGGRAALLVDQRVHPNEGKAYRFFGRPAYTSPLLARLSLRTGAPVVPFFGFPEDGGRRCRVVFRPPIWPGPDGPLAEPYDGGPEGASEADEDRRVVAIDALTLRYLEVQEEEIRRRPELWLWMHRRWRKNPTDYFKNRIPRTAAGPDSDEVVGAPERDRLRHRSALKPPPGRPEP